MLCPKLHRYRFGYIGSYTARFTSSTHVLAHTQIHTNKHYTVTAYWFTFIPVVHNTCNLSLSLSHTHTHTHTHTHSHESRVKHVVIESKYDPVTGILYHITPSGPFFPSLYELVERARKKPLIQNHLFDIKLEKCPPKVLHTSGVEFYAVSWISFCTCLIHVYAANLVSHIK